MANDTEDKQRELFEALLNKESFNPANKYSGSKDKSRRKRKKEIDLHGMNRYDAEDVVTGLLRSYRHSDVMELTIICGKGRHSPAGPVIYRHIRDFLKSNSHLFSSMKTDKNNNITLRWKE